MKLKNLITLFGILFSVLGLANTPLNHVLMGFNIADLMPSTELSVWYKLDEKDRVYVEGRLKEIHAGITKLDQQAQDLQGLSDGSKLNRSVGISLEQFVQKAREFQRDFRALENQVGGLSLLHRTLPSFKDRKLNFEAAVQFYNSAKAELVGQVSALTFFLKGHNGKVVLHRGLDVDALLVTAQSSAEERRGLRNEITKQRIMKTQDQTQIETLFKYTHKTLSYFVRTYGSSQRYRYAENPQGLERDVRKISDLFMVRSYLRALYRVRIGVVGIQYKKGTFHSDLFSSSEVPFLSQPVTQDAVIQELQDHVNSAHKSHSEKLGHHSEWNYGLSLLVRAYSYLQGDSQLVAQNVFVFELLKNDMEEEMMIGDPSSDLMSHFKARYYYRNPEEKERNVRILKELFKEGALGEVSVDSLQGVLNTVLPAFQNFEDQAGESRHNEDLLNQLLDPSNPLTQRRKERAEKLDL